MLSIKNNFYNIYVTIIKGRYKVENHSFIGLGKNPDPNVSDIPIGFGMELMQNSEARSNFDKLNDNEKNQLINYIQNNNSSDEAKNKISISIENLKKGNINFF
jgi:hypothetical protein